MHGPTNPKFKMSCQVQILYRTIRFAHPGIRQVSPTPGVIFFELKIKN